MCDASVEVGSSVFGRGLFATQPFAAGEPILVFAGPSMSHGEILSLGEDQAYALQIGPDQYMDTMPPGRYTNHSCDPNAGIAQDRVLIAIRPIVPGEEIRFDYSTTMSEDHWTMECRCGTPRCRRLIQDFHHLPAITQARYLQLGIVQRFIVDEVERRASADRTIRRAPTRRVG